eukprot:6314856-Prorocentrum_lima.AAC.1
MACKGGQWRAMAGNGRQWQAMAGNGRQWQAITCNSMQHMQWHGMNLHLITRQSATTQNHVR